MQPDPGLQVARVNRGWPVNIMCRECLNFILLIYVHVCLYIKWYQKIIQRGEIIINKQDIKDLQ